jgi:hypothetical protein
VARKNSLSESAGGASLAAFGPAITALVADVTRMGCQLMASAFMQSRDSGKESLANSSGPLHNLPCFAGMQEYNHRSEGASQQFYDIDRSQFLPRFDQRLKKIWWGGEWLNWRSAITTVIGCGPPYYDFDRISRSALSDAEKGELTRFLLTLRLWETTPGTKEMQAQWVWQSALTDGASFADDLSDIFDIRWREGEWPDSYNFAFPAKFLPRFNSEKDDLPLCLLPTSALPEALMEFESVLNELLDEIDWEDVRLPSDSEILYERSTSTSFDADREKRAPQWLFSLEKPTFETECLRGSRCIIPVYASNVRDTIIADIRANHSIRWIERVMRHILEYVPESADALYSSTYLSRLDNYRKKEGYHALRDIKKCGITYNTKDLFPIVFSLLRSRKPDKRWDRSNIYKRLEYLDMDGEWYEAQRGYFLGMANHTVTLCNIVISRIARKVTYSRRNFKESRCTCIIGNDDLAAVFYPKNEHSKILANEYLDNEHEIHAALGNITNKKKSVVKDHGLFYENYSAPGWQNKESLVCNALACAYLAPSIRVAKHYISSQSDRFKNKWAFARLRELAEYWGAEFFDVETELRITSEMGGWIKQTSYSLSTALLDLDDLWPKFHYQVPIAYEVCRRYFSCPKPEYKTPGWVANHLYNGRAGAAPPQVQIFKLVQDDVLTFYKKLTSYQRNFARRIKTSQANAKSANRTFEQIQRSILRTNPWHCIPDSLVGYTSWTDTGAAYLPACQELMRHDNDPFDSMLRGELDERDNVFTWDPNIPSYAIDTTVQTSIWMYQNCSQFSNTGCIPIVEYFNRNRIYPNAKLGYGRIRHPPIEKTPEKQNQPPGPRRHYEVCRYGHITERVDIEVIPDEPLVVEDFAELVRQAEEDLYGKVEVLPEKKSFIGTGVIGSLVKEGEEVDTDELLERLLNHDDTEGDHAIIDRGDRLDVFENSDDDLGLNLDSW